MMLSRLVLGIIGKLGCHHPRKRMIQCGPTREYHMQRSYWVYILASKMGGTLYIGVTNDLVRRVYEHRMGVADGFTKKYGVHRLVCFEQHHDIEAAIVREKQMKKWNRAWKITLIEKDNPTWKDLYPDIAGS
jgi:putative endonuclease